MICEACGAEALKTVRWRAGGERRFVLCDECYGPLAASVWITEGLVPCSGTCNACGSWVSVRELSEASGGGRRDAPSGLCRSCVR